MAGNLTSEKGVRKRLTTSPDTFPLLIATNRTDAHPIRPSNVSTPISMTRRSPVQVAAALDQSPACRSESHCPSCRSGAGCVSQPVGTQTCARFKRAVSMLCGRAYKDGLSCNRDSIPKITGSCIRHDGSNDGIGLCDALKACIRGWCNG